MRYQTFREAALALPGATEQPHHHYGSFRVNGRIFATVPPEREHVHLFVAETDRELALATHAECTEKLLWGGKVVGLRVNLAAAPAAQVKVWLQQAYAAKSAPARSSRALRSARPAGAAGNRQRRQG